MNTTEVFLLSMISQSPRYGYEIAQFLEETNANLWINLSMTYVYRLLKNFEDRGWVKAQMVKSDNRPNKKVFQITKIGKKALEEELTKGRFKIDKIYFNVDVALAVYTITDKSFNLRALIENQIAAVEEELEQFNIDNPDNEKLTEDEILAMLIIQHRIGFFQSELEWLKKVRSVLDKGEQS
ncbi:MAG: PadR family transcriptional regulator [Firmicutes bacterium]|nr:PadR family transcriptional regulator [Bacillota bacterium]